MGFFNSFITEFGKKTGKALGNKLYGKYADDVRVSYRSSSSKKKDKNKGWQLLVLSGLILILALLVLLA